MNDTVTIPLNNLSAITARRDELLAERKRLHEQRVALLAQTRRVDRELSDCRGAARFFGIDLEFPDDEGTPSAVTVGKCKQQ